jgi:hypothetical protein
MPYQYENPITGQMKQERYRTEREALLAWRDLAPAEKETHRLVSDDRGPYRIVIESTDLPRKFQELQVGLDVYIEKEEYFRERPELRSQRPDPGPHMRQLRPDELL